MLVPWLFGWTELTRDPELNRAFDVALHLGTFVGALAYFRQDLVALASAALRSLRRRSVDQADERLAWLLLVSSLPAALVGALLDSLVEGQLGAEWLIGVLLVAFGLVLLWADRLPGSRDEGEFGLREALLMGTAQACALQPGVSRSGVTISMARWLRFERGAATRLSFLMSLPVIGGAGLYEGVKLVAGDGLPPGFLPAFVWGTLTSAVTGFLAVWALLRYVRTRSFAPFVAYRAVVGTAVVAVAASSFR